MKFNQMLIHCKITFHSVVRFLSWSKILVWNCWYDPTLHHFCRPVLRTVIQLTKCTWPYPTDIQKSKYYLHMHWFNLGLICQHLGVKSKRWSNLCFQKSKGKTTDVYPEISWGIFFLRGGDLNLRELMWVGYCYEYFHGGRPLPTSLAECTFDTMTGWLTRV